MTLAAVPTPTANPEEEFIRKTIQWYRNHNKADGFYGNGHVGCSYEQIAEPFCDHFDTDKQSLRQVLTAMVEQGTLVAVIRHNERTGTGCERRTMCVHVEVLEAIPDRDVGENRTLRFYLPDAMGREIARAVTKIEERKKLIREITTDRPEVVT